MLNNGEEKEKLLRQRQQRSKEAIDLAMQGRWRDAVGANKSIVEDFPDDVEAYNRMGRAYTELGEYSHAREAYKHTVELDPYNSIAKKNLQRLSYLKDTARPQAESHKVEPQHFIEEIGKAGVVSLYDVARKEILAKMVAGDNVVLKIDKLNLRVENGRKELLGLVDIKHAQRLIKLMEGGNKYSAAVLNTNENAITVIIRETYQDPSQAGKLSFPPRQLEEVRPYASDRVLKLEEEEGEDSGYTVVGGDEVEVLPEEPANNDEESDEEAANNEKRFD